jgi:hypothetical protein
MGEHSTMDGTSAGGIACRNPVSFVEDVEIVGDSFDGPYYVLRDGTTVHVPVGHADEVSED